MLEIRKSSTADFEIEDIWQYSFEKWGEWQADNYNDKLSDAMAQLSQMPQIGAPRDKIRAGLRGYHVGRHVIYYYVRTDHIYVVRVRHDRSDPYLYEE